MNRRKAQTLEQLLSNMPDGKLLDIEDELQSGVIPATSKTHEFIRHINRLIDKGELCINPTCYRRIYLPTLARAVHKELARRYCHLVTLGLVSIEEQDKTEDSE